MNTKNNNIIFGTINVETGETQDGYIDKNGQMKYKKQPWYKRIFQKRPEEIEYIGITQLYSKFIWSHRKHYFDAAVYRRFNPYTNKTYAIYSTNGNRIVYFNIDAFEKNGALIVE